MNTLVIGVGNEFRQDDGFGIAVARELASRKLEQVEVLERSGEGGSILAALEGQDKVFLIDAVDSGAEPGKLYRLNAAADPIPTSFLHYSCHDFAVAEALELARTLERLPQVTVVYGVEGSRFGYGAGLTGPVQEQVRGVADRLEEEITGSACR